MQTSIFPSIIDVISWTLTVQFIPQKPDHLIRLFYVYLKIE